MTVIIGAEHNGKVYMGGDSASLNGGWGVNALSGQKVFIHQQKFLIGVAGQPRLHDILKHQLDVRPQTEGESDEHYMVDGFIMAVREALRANGHLTQEEGRETIDTSDIMVGYNGLLYWIGSDLEVLHFREQVAGIGSGADLAVGALSALLRERPTLPIETLMQKALKIAGDFSASVRPPYYVEKL